MLVVHYIVDGFLQEFVRQQVAEKERAKMEERLRHEREDALEEARLAMERERMKADFRREKEKARRKEVRIHTYNNIIYQAVSYTHLTLPTIYSV